MKKINYIPAKPVQHSKLHLFCSSLFAFYSQYLTITGDATVLNL